VDENWTNIPSAAKAVFVSKLTARLPFDFSQGKKSCPDKTPRKELDASKVLRGL